MGGGKGVGGRWVEKRGGGRWVERGGGEEGGLRWKVSYCRRMSAFLASAYTGGGKGVEGGLRRGEGEGGLRGVMEKRVG